MLLGHNYNKLQCSTRYKRSHTEHHRYQRQATYADITSVVVVVVLVVVVVNVKQVKSALFIVINNAATTGKYL